MDAIIFGINESRHWLFPLLIGCILVVLAAEIAGAIRCAQEEIERMFS